jgi:hypothetical protein
VAVLEAEPTGWASWNALIKSNGAPVTELSISAWKSRGSFSLNGQEFTIEPRGFWLHNAVLQRGGTIIAKAEKPALMRRHWVLSSAGHRLDLESRSWTGRDYVLSLGGREVGSIKRQGITGRKISLQFPDEVPEVLQIFLTYIVLCQAKREASAAAAGS